MMANLKFKSNMYLNNGLLLEIAEAFKLARETAKIEFAPKKLLYFVPSILQSSISKDF